MVLGLAIAVFLNIRSNRRAVIVAQANEKVSEIIAEGERALSEGDIDVAEAKLSNADSIVAASDKQLIDRFRATLEIAHHRLADSAKAQREVEEQIRRSEFDAKAKAKATAEAIAQEMAENERKKQEAEALAKLQEEERRAAIEHQRKVDEDRRQQEIARERALAVEKENLEALERERKSPTRTPTVEDVNDFPDRYYGKPVRFDEVTVWGDIERLKDVRGGTYAVVVKSRRGKIFSNIASREVFFTLPNNLAEKWMKALPKSQEFQSCFVYCQIVEHEVTYDGRKLSRTIPEAQIYKIDVGGDGVLVFE